LEQSQQVQQIEEIIGKRAESMRSKTLANIETAPLTYSQRLLRSQSKIESGFEHEFSFSKEIKLGNVQSLEREQSELKNQANVIESQQSIVSVRNQIKNSYHQYCLEKLYSSTYEERFERVSLLYSKKQRAFEEGEISKTELMQIALEKEQLQGELEQFNQRVQYDRNYLFSLSNLSQEESFSCSDLYPIQESLVSDNDELTLSTQSYEKRIASVKKGLERYGKEFDSIELSGVYLRELGRDLYSIGVSVPLNFSSKKYEYERASLMQQSSALSLEKEQLVSSKRREIARLNSKLTQSYQAIALEEALIESHKEKLIPLIDKSYHYGESSVVEYLLAQQSMSRLEEKLLEEKRAYYRTLFSLLTIQEKK
jgi:outer membrane protein TolC